MRLSVTFLGTLPPLKGNAFYCWSLARALAKHVDVDFISFRSLYPERMYPGGTEDDDPQFVAEEEPGLVISRPLRYNLPVTWITTAMSIESHLVHAQWWSIPVGLIWMVMFTILKLRGRRILLTVHNVLPHEGTLFSGLISRLVFLLCEGFFVHSERNKEQLQKHFQIPEEKITVVPMGLHDMYQSGPTVDRKQARADLKLPAEARVLLLFGNIRPYKGIETALAALFLIKQKKWSHPYRLLIAGQPWVNWKPYDELIEHYSLRAEVGTHLTYIPMSGVRPFFEAADLVLLPYKAFEAQSGVGLIALAFQKPMVVTNVGGLPELVVDPRLVIEPNEPDDLADRIELVLEDPKTYQRCCEDAARISEGHSWQTVAQRTHEVYRKLTSP